MERDSQFSSLYKMLFRCSNYNKKHYYNAIVEKVYLLLINIIYNCYFVVDTASLTRFTFCTTDKEKHSVCGWNQWKVGTSSLALLLLMNLTYCGM